MIARRQRFTPAMRRRLAEVDAKSGGDVDDMERQSAFAEQMLPVVDRQRPEVRALLNDFPYGTVVKALQITFGDAKAARVFLTQSLGKPI